MADEQQIGNEVRHKWGMVIDTDRCTGCQACVVACQAENNIPLNEERHFIRHRAMEWIRVERYWEGEFPNVKARYLPVLCQHCENAPCEPVCPVYAIQHSSEGLNVQTYNRCVGTRYCGNNCPYNIRMFNWEPPQWPDSLHSQLNSDVTVRTQGLIEKCSFCVQRINRSKRDEVKNGKPMADGDLQPACAQACPTNAIIFGDWKDPKSRVNQLAPDARNEKRSTDSRTYRLIEHFGTEPSVAYLMRVDPNAPAPRERATASVQFDRMLPVISG